MIKSAELQQNEERNKEHEMSKIDDLIDDIDKMDTKFEAVENLAKDASKDVDECENKVMELEEAAKENMKSTTKKFVQVSEILKDQKGRILSLESGGVPKEFDKQIDSLKRDMIDRKEHEEKMAELAATVTELRDRIDLQATSINRLSLEQKKLKDDMKTAKSVTAEPTSAVVSPAESGPRTPKKSVTEPRSATAASETADKRTKLAGARVQKDTLALETPRGKSRTPGSTDRARSTDKRARADTPAPETPTKRPRLTEKLGPKPKAAQVVSRPATPRTKPDKPADSRPATPRIQVDKPANENATDEDEFAGLLD